MCSLFNFQAGDIFLKAALIMFSKQVFHIYKSILNSVTLANFPSVMPYYNKLFSVSNSTLAKFNSTKFQNQTKALG